MYLIGLSGKKRSGKNATADFIEEQFPEGTVIKIAFADALKEEVAKACGVTVNFVEEHKDMFRPILQWWGTEFRRKLNGDDYWINKVLYKLTQASLTTKVAIITDVRFPNEADMVRKCHGLVLRVERGQPAEDNHPSEVALDNYNFDAVIPNISNLDILKSNTINTLKNLCIHQ